MTQQLEIDQEGQMCDGATFNEFLLADLDDPVQIQQQNNLQYYDKDQWLPIKRNLYAVSSICNTVSICLAGYMFYLV